MATMKRQDFSIFVILLKSTAAYCLLILSIYIIKILIKFTGDDPDLVLPEKAFTIIKTWGFVFITIIEMTEYSFYKISKIWREMKAYDLRERKRRDERR